MSERYRIQITAGAEKDLKRYRHAASAVVKVLSKLELFPQSGNALAGDLMGIRSLEFAVNGNGAFRVAYEMDKLEGVCLVIAIGPREGFYDRLRRRIEM